MKILLDFEECIKDSPAFRDLVHQSEVEIIDLENQLDRMTKTCSAMVDSGKTYNNVSRVFVSSLDDVAAHSKQDAFVHGSLKRFSSTMTELSNFHTMLFDQAQLSVKNQLLAFLKEDVKGTRDLKKAFDKVSEDYSGALSKHAAVNRLKPNEIEDASSNLASNRANFRNVSMDYVYQINMLQRKSRFQAVDKMLSYMHALATFFHQGYDLMNDLEPFMKALSTQLHEMNVSNEAERKAMVTEQERHKAMTSDSGIHMRCVRDTLVIEGHLFKRASNAFKTWNRRWFTIKKNQLLYQKKKDDVTVVIDDIRLCTVRAADDHERRFCFEIISPGKSFLLQAESEEAKMAWIRAIQSSIGAAFKDTIAGAQSPCASEQTKSSLPLATTSTTTPATSSNHKSAEPPVATEPAKKSDNSNPTSFLEDGDGNTMARIYKVEGNRLCADCGRSDPRWASISLGVTLCIDCSGVHRSLGVHVSKVRSLTLDQWEPEVVKIMISLGNSRANEIYIPNLPNDEAIKPSCSNKERQTFVKAKYVERKYSMSLPSPGGGQCQDAKGRPLTRWTVSKRRKAKKSVDITSPKADVSSDVSPVEKNTNGDDVLVFGQTTHADSHVTYDANDVYDMSRLQPDLLFYNAAAAANLPVMLLAKCNGASVNAKNDDDDGKSPLMQAATTGSIQACEFLLVNGASVNDKDARLRTALHYAALHNHTGVTCQLLKRRVDVDAIDTDGKSALEIAVDAANADIVTLIRLKKMNDEMKADDSYQQNDDLVSDVFRDFTRRATSALHSPDVIDSPRSFNIIGATLCPPTPKSDPPPDGDREQPLIVLEDEPDEAIESTV